MSTKILALEEVNPIADDIQKAIQKVRQVATSTGVIPRSLNVPDDAIIIMALALLAERIERLND